MFTSLILVAVFGMPANDLLPDLGIWDQELLDNAIDTTTIPGRILLRLSTGTPNLGIGRLELRGGAIVGSTQEVNQRIYRNDNTFWERPAGTFTYHSSHSHIHFDGWCRYRLRTITAGNGVGPVLATGQKTSFCILDLRVHNTANPGFVNPGYYSGCGASVQGLTPGWADIYSKNLTDQWIDITGIADGDYWLEAEVDPDGKILEESESNNIGRVQVHIGLPPPPTADAYEENDSKAQVDARAEGTNSPQLGLINARKMIANLSITASDPDWFRFRTNRTGGAGDYVHITSIYSGGDMDMTLYNSAGTVIGSGTSGSNTEQISMNGRAPGYYYVRVFPYSGTNPNYTFTVQPSGNLPPVFSLTEPNQTTYVERALMPFRVAWTATDPESDPMRVSIFMDRGQIFGKSTIPVQGYQSMAAGDGTANVNTAEMPLGRWYVFAQCTDGGMNTTSLAPAPVVVYKKGDLNFDNRVTKADYHLLLQEIARTRNTPLSIATVNICDFDYDNDFDTEDLEEFQERMGS